MCELRSRHRTPQPSSDSKLSGMPMGYGYLWWTAPREGGRGMLGPGWYAALGAGGPSTPS